MMALSSAGSAGAAAAERLGVLTPLLVARAERAMAVVSQGKDGAEQAKKAEGDADDEEGGEQLDQGRCQPCASSIRTHSSTVSWARKGSSLCVEHTMTLPVSLVIATGVAPQAGRATRSEAIKAKRIMRTSLAMVAGE